MGTMTSPFISKAELMKYGQDLKLFFPDMGELQTQLYEGEYDLFKYAPVFESCFVQVTRKGEPVDIHNHVTLITLGIAATSPLLPMPNVMLLARPKIINVDPRKKDFVEQLQLSRLFPLKLVRLSVSDISMRQIKVKLATGRSFYLQLHAPQDKEETLFQQWMDLIYRLHPASTNHPPEFTVESTSSQGQSPKSSEEKINEKILGIRSQTVHVTELQKPPASQKELDHIYMQDDADEENIDDSQLAPIPDRGEGGRAQQAIHPANPRDAQEGHAHHAVEETTTSTPSSSDDIPVAHKKKEKAVAKKESVYVKREADHLKKERVHSRKDSGLTSVLEHDRKAQSLTSMPHHTKKISKKKQSPSNKKQKGGSPHSKKKLSTTEDREEPTKLQSMLKTFSKNETKEQKKKKR